MQLDSLACLHMPLYRRKERRKENKRVIIQREYQTLIVISESSTRQ